MNRKGWRKQEQSELPSLFRIDVVINQRLINIVITLFKSDHCCISGHPRKHNHVSPLISHMGTEDRTGNAIKLSLNLGIQTQTLEHQKFLAEHGCWEFPSFKGIYKQNLQTRTYGPGDMDKNRPPGLQHKRQGAAQLRHIVIQVPGPRCETAKDGTNKAIHSHHTGL
jgi:hypothetical protein